MDMNDTNWANISEGWLFDEWKEVVVNNLQTKTV